MINDLPRLLFVLVLTSCTALSAAQGQLRRTYSTNPSVDKLKHAIIAGDKVKMVELSELLPQSVDYQYAFIGLTANTEVKKALLEIIENYWVKKIEGDPQAALQALLFGMSILKKSCSTGDLEEEFKQLLITLRNLFLERSVLPVETSNEWAELVALASEDVTEKGGDHSQQPSKRVVAYSLCTS